jgi:hypothetical protein
MMTGLASRQRGAALLLLLSVLMLGSSWYLVSRLNAESGAAAAARKARNATVLNKAKQALIGYIAAQANFAGENRPGAFPCPEAPADFNVSASEGTVSYPCALPIVGRFPWRTLGMDKLVDASGEPLWYAIAPGWAGAATVINSECASPSAATGLACSSPGGRLTVDGVTNDVIALIIAPGPAFAVPAHPTDLNCAAWTQARPTAAPPDWRNYLECENASSPANVTFATFKKPYVNPITKVVTQVFNDQVVTITVGEVMPVIEAAIADRIEREVLPALQTVYTAAAWGFTGAPIPTLNPVLPYPATFANPASGVGNSNYQGAAATYRGLLPFNQANCAPAAANPRCSNIFLVFSKSGNDAKIAGGGSIRTQSACAWQASVYVCTGEYNQPSISLTAAVRVTNVAMGLRAFDSSKVTCTAVDDVGNGIAMQTVACASTAVLQSDGSAIVTVVTGALPDVAGSGWGTYANYMINVDRLAFGDHSLLDTANATTGWFARNEWFRLVYYAVAPSNTAVRLAAANPAERSCGAVGDCLALTTSSGASIKSALLILAGRIINGAPRPSAILGDYFEFGNASAAYESRTVTPKAAMIYADTGAANAYAVAIATLATGTIFQFRAVNANTGNSTLNTAATGVRSLVNQDGSNLAAATIKANAAVEVTWDGANNRFVLSKRPFNDRVVAVGSN